MEGIANYRERKINRDAMFPTFRESFPGKAVTGIARITGNRSFDGRDAIRSIAEIAYFRMAVIRVPVIRVPVIRVPVIRVPVIRVAVSGMGMASEVDVRHVVVNGLLVR